VALILSSSFSINMLPANACTSASFAPLDLEEARALLAEFGEVTNMVNPRHESTARLSELLCGKPAEGGFLSLEEGRKAVILVMLPPRDMMSRSGAEIEVKDLEEVQLFEVGINLD
jgi:hypothetical protein